MFARSWLVFSAAAIQNPFSIQESLGMKVAKTWDFHLLYFVWKTEGRKTKSKGNNLNFDKFKQLE
jgi:hypothetical protein